MRGRGCVWLALFVTSAVSIASFSQMMHDYAGADFIGAGAWCFSGLIWAYCAVRTIEDIAS